MQLVPRHCQQRESTIAFLTDSINLHPPALQEFADLAGKTPLTFHCLDWYTRTQAIQCIVSQQTLRIVHLPRSV